jgi:SAM-dependent methyltransferase
MQHYSTCPLCDSAEIGLFLQTNDLFLTSEPFSLFICRSCGFVFTQDHPDAAAMGRYYESEEYNSHNDSAGGLISSIYRLSRNLMLRRKRRLITSFTGLEKGQLLDIGSGTGHFLNEMKNSGWDVKGIEVSEDARNYSVNSLGVDVLAPDDLPYLPDQSFDCITLWHVLEHIHDLKGYASGIKRLLKPTGKCVVALPNCNSYDAEHYKKFWAAYDVPRHLWHFSPASFSYYARKNGFQILGMRSLPLDVFYISILSEKYRGVKFSFITGLLKGTWFSFRSLVNRKKSSSLVFLIRKIA